ncbi:MAG: transcriptional regulator, partial [Leptolyngbyaceae cyanobacterium bins.59]|nr:transcriptional regulator [Leptolyngbyaceae cyanobacterium bins.59]
VPYQAKKGRCKIETRAATSPSLFPDGKSSPFASAIVIWEACNLLAQRRSLSWERDVAGNLVYQRQLSQDRGALTFQITHPPLPNSQATAPDADTLALLENFDIRAACLHLIFAAHATALERPWEQEFVVDDQQLEEYLGMEKRKDLSKTARLALLQELIQQVCQLQVAIEWSQQGRVMAFSLEANPLWHLLEVRHHFQDDHLGCKHLVGLTFRVKAGEWSQYFLNKQGCRESTAFYQYGNLPRSLLMEVMSIWQQHEGAARMLLWLLFKMKMGKEQRIMVPTLMRVGYGEEKVVLAASHREGRKRLLRTFESDLEVLNHYGLKPVFDPVTYPSEIQPLWAKLVDLPDDAEAALEFWTNDGSNNTRLTDAAPRGKWNRLMNARLLCFEMPKDWETQSTARSEKKQKRTTRKASARSVISLSAQQIVAARKDLQLSQRSLATQIGKSQSWIRDVESGRLRVNVKDQALLRKVLGIA